MVAGWAGDHESDTVAPLLECPDSRQSRPGRRASRRPRTGPREGVGVDVTSTPTAVLLEILEMDPRVDPRQIVQLRRLRRQGHQPTTELEIGDTGHDGIDPGWTFRMVWATHMLIGSTNGSGEDQLHRLCPRIAMTLHPPPFPRGPPGKTFLNLS